MGAHARILGGIATLAVALAGSSVPLSQSTKIAQLPGPPLSGERILVQVEELGTYVSGGIHGATKTTSSVGTGLAPGETGYAFVAVGSVDAEGRPSPNGLCGSSCGSVPETKAEAKKQRLLGNAPHLWWIKARALPSEVGKASLELDWEHWYSERRGSFRKVGGDVRTLTMREGESHVLDFVDMPPNAETHCSRNALIRVVVTVEEDPTLAEEKIAYDLWYEHRDAQGRATIRRYQAVGKQGERLDYRFLPLRFPAPGLTLPDGSGIDSILEISGSLRGRVRADGTIEVRLDASRWVDAERAGDPRRGGIGDGGEKVFSVTQGETVRMELPETSRGRTGLVVEGREFWVDNGQFYAGHRDALVLTVSRER